MKDQHYNIIFFAFGIILFIPALLINLGLMPLIEDESIRALVAMEMMISGDYWTPTLGGELYFKKPPLYNWIIVLFFKAFQFSDFVFRLPVVLILIGFCYLIYQLAKKAFGQKAALLAALFFLTNGRVFFYESLYGLIDLLFSLLIFVNFFLIYGFFKKYDYKRLFLYSYLLIAFAFLLKGLPSLVFQGVTLFALFVWKKQFWKLFNAFHFLGIGLFLLIVGSYYAVYFSNNQGTFYELFLTLVTESTRRTPIRFGFWETIKHFLLFPLEMIYHFLPWTLLCILLVFKPTYQIIRSHEIIQYLLLMVGANIIVYWVSPEVHPRYVLMLVALIFVVFAYLYVVFEEQNHFIIRYLHSFLKGIIILMLLLPIVGFFIHEIRFIPYLYLKISGLLLVNIGLSWFWIRSKKHIIFVTILMLAVVRIGFDLFVLPHRNVHSKSAIEREEAINIAQFAGENTIQAYWPKNKKPGDYYGKRVMQYAPMYYITREQRTILRSVSSLEKGEYYLAKPRELKGEKYTKLGKIQLKAGGEIVLIKVNGQ